MKRFMIQVIFHSVTPHCSCLLKIKKKSKVQSVLKNPLAHTCTNERLTFDIFNAGRF